MTPAERALRWLESTPGAVSGSGGHNATFAVATALVHGFCLDENTAHSLMVGHWNGKCQPPWTARDIAHKVSQSATVGHSKPRGWMLTEGGSKSPVAESKKFVYHKNPVAIPEPKGMTTRDFLIQAFLPEEKVCICTDVDVDEAGKARPVGRGTFQTLEWWLKEYFPDGGEMASLFKQKGTYLRINPCSDDTGSDNGVSSYRHVLVESDSLPKDEQKAALLASKLPFTALIDSGGSSIHGWVRVDAADRKEWEQRRDEVYKALEHVGIDAKNKNASRFSRLPGAFRDGVEQKLVALRVGPQTWDEYLDEKESENFPKPLLISKLVKYDKTLDTDNIIGDRWLRRGGSVMLCGQTGVGKSSLLMSQAISWALGIPWWGIAVHKPIKIGIIQAENDEADLADAFQGLCFHHRNDWSRETVEALEDKVIFFEIKDLCGESFIRFLHKIVIKHKLDMVYIDPLIAYIGGDISKQEHVSGFLRQGLAPILKQTGVIANVFHHFPKPKGKDEQATSTADMAYSGTGSSDLANFFREVIVLRENGSADPREFTLALTKRGNRAGMVDHLGNPAKTINIRHSASGSMAWEYCAPPKFVVDRSKSEKGKSWKR